MSSSHARGQMSSRNHALRRYIDRHSGLIVCVSLGFAAASCLGLILLFGIYAALGGSNSIVIALGLSLWLVFNGWAIRRFMASLRRRADAESDNLRFERFKPLQPTG